jgi:lipopolysaccharide/colanic/teichoic acid biosynthesis glycosyltransferase
MSAPATGRCIDPTHRVQLIQELHRRYSRGGASLRWRFWIKKYAWVVAVGGAKLVKRLFDIAVSLGMLLLLSPLFLVVAAAIKLTDGGDIFFWQTRVGLWGREFRFPKFRSMVRNAEQLKDKLLAQNQHGSAGVTFKMKNDPRITAIGRIIRRLSIDELPQVWCVLKGDMSIVGPRPPVPREVALYTLADRRRLDVTPGLTCIWQVSGRGDIPFPQQVQLDVDYIESRSFWLDIKLILATVPAVLLGKGAY